MTPRFSRRATGDAKPAADRAAAVADETPDVFLSYSRRDQLFALRIAAALERAGWGVWVDTEDVPPASEWREELADGIRSAHTFVFLLSSRSVGSEFCRWELEQAVAFGKRIVPLVLEDVVDAPEQLASRQYVFMRPSDDFDKAIKTVTAALGTDLEWVKGHRRWLVEALRWESEDRDRSLLVRGRDLKAAEAWLGRQGDRTEPRPTPLQAEFLVASRAWETRRIQIIAIGVGIALAVAVGLGVVALFQRDHARTEAAIARSRELAVSSTSQLAVDPERSLLLAIEAVKTRPTSDAENALRRAVLATRLRAEVPTESKRIGALVNDVVFSPDGRFVAGGSNDGTVAVASSTAQRGTRARALPGPSISPGNFCSLFSRGGASQERVVFDPDGRRIAADDSRGWIQVWDWPHPRKPVTSPFCLDRTTSPAAVDLVSPALQSKSFAPAALRVSSTHAIDAVRPDGRLLRWSWTSHRKPTLVRIQRRPIVAAALSGSGRNVAVADATGVGIWTLSGRRLYRTLAVRGVTDVAVDADGSRVAIAGDAGVVVWDPAAAHPPLVLRTPDVVRSLAMSRDGTVIATGDDAHAIRIWDLSRGRVPVVLRGSQGSVTALAFSADGRLIVSGGDDGVFRIWAWDASRQASSPVGRPARILLSQDGHVVAVDPRDRGRLVIGVAGLTRTVERAANPRDLSLSSDGLHAVAAVAPLDSGRLQLWDLARSPRPRTIAISPRVSAAAVSPDGRWLTVAAYGNLEIGRWPGKRFRTLARSRAGVYTAVAFDRDTIRVAAAAYDGKNSDVSVWRLPGAGDEAAAETRPPVATFAALGEINALAFSHDGTRLAAAGSDGAVRVWALSGSAPAVVLRGHHGSANAVAFSPDDTEVVSGGHDGSVRLWELAEGSKSVTIRGPGGAVTNVAFTAGGDLIAVGTGGARVWRCDFCGAADRVLARARRMATRELTAEERALYLHER